MIRIPLPGFLCKRFYDPNTPPFHLRSLYYQIILLGKFYVALKSPKRKILVTELIAGKENLIPVSTFRSMPLPINSSAETPNTPYTALPIRSSVYFLLRMNTFMIILKQCSSAVWISGSHRLFILVWYKKE